MKKVFDMKTLNASQERVVLLPVDNDILSVAGPGSGKTRTVTYRLAYLATACGILPSRLRAVTFTRAATQEMQGTFVFVGYFVGSSSYKHDSQTLSRYYQRDTRCSA